MYDTSVTVTNADIPFYGREILTQRLSHQLTEIAETGRGQMLAVKGRRQSGKSRLFTRFAEASGIPHLYFTAVKNADPAAQLEELARNIFVSTSPLPDSETLFATPPANWTDAFARLALTARTTPAIIVLDEFPWAAETDSTLEGVLQNAWDRQLQDLPILVVLIGSDVAVMERLTTHDRPLFGRTKHMTVQPFNVGECAQALGHGSSAMAAFDTWLVTGGYPRLVVDCARARNVTTFVQNQLSDENNDLVVVGQRVVDAEFPEGDQARRVLSAIGGTEVGLATFSQVVGRLSSSPGTAEETATTRAVKLLSEVKGVVSIDRPLGTPTSTKLRRYRISDPYLRFWFRFIAPQAGNISRGRADIARNVFERDWTTWRGKAVEPIVQESVLRLGAFDKRLSNIEQVGGWWNRDNSIEVDLVGANSKGEVSVLGSVKWRERTQFNSRELAALTEDRRIVPGASNARLLAICPAGSRKEAVADIILGPNELLSAWLPT